MASRENQGLQIALIASAFPIVALGIATYLYYSSYKEATVKAASATKESADARQSMTKAIDEATELKKLMGWGAKDDLATIQAAFKKDLETYAASMRDSEQNYRNVAATLSTELQAKNKLLVDKEATIRKTEADLRDLNALKKKEFDKYATDFKKSEDDASSEHSKFDEDRNKFKKGTAEISRKLETKAKDFDEQLAQHDKNENELTAIVTEKTQYLDKLTGIIREREESAEMADGKVTWVNQAARLAWVNLGSEDGLRKQISFDVIGADETKLIIPKKDSKDPDVRKGNIKANIEVIRILDHHLAEARIIEDDPSSPILPGDQLYSVAWRPNHPEHFALVGLLDLDKDGVSDLDKIKNLITINGGIIDSELRDDGKRVGKITADTRYLVVGKEPTEKNGNDYVTNYTKMMSEAKGLPVKMITLDYLVAYLGYKDHERTVPLGADAKASDFKPRNPADVSKRKMPDPSIERRQVPPHPIDRSY